MKKEEIVKPKIIENVLKYYLTSKDFNGLPLSSLRQNLPEATDDLIRDLVNHEAIFLSHSDFVINPHIIMHNPQPIETQLSLIGAGKLEKAVLYPTTKLLGNVVDQSAFVNTPLRLYMALGYPQLGVLLFYPSVLEQYRNDPRYIYETDDICGRLVVNDEFFESGNIPESDEVMLKRFGFAVSKDGHRAVAAILRDLGELSPEHQQIWSARQIPGDLLADHDYRLIDEYQRTLYGLPRERCSLSTAYMYELNAINEIVEGKYGARIFIRDWMDGFDRLNDLTMLLSPTRKEYSNFVHLLDKTLSDNLNKKFFAGKVVLEREAPLPDGRVKVENKGTLALLREWLDQEFPDDSKRINQLLTSLNRIRKERQKPAHVIERDQFDPKFWEAQRELLANVHGGLKAFRELLCENLGFKLKPSTLERVHMAIVDA